MDKQAHEYLKRFYSKLYDNLEISKKLKNKSVLRSFFVPTSSNSLLVLLNNSTIISESISNDTLEYLLAEGYIRAADKTNNYSITAKGVWQIELENKQISVDDLITEIDNRFFNFFTKNEGLKAKDKIIIFSMIAIRAFSEESAIDLKRSKSAEEALKEILEESCVILKEQKVISEKDKISKESATEESEGTIKYIFKRVTSLPKITRGIFKIGKDYKFYLDLYKNSNIKMRDFSFLFWLIYGNKMTEEMRARIFDFFVKIAYEKSVHLFDLKKHIFAKPDYDDVLKEALDEYFISRRIWKID